jgi:C1A family cysteine protease
LTYSVTEDPDEEYNYASPDQWLKDDIELGAFDWRKKIKLGKVKNQKKCGSCWAFAALTTLEHHLQIHKHVKVELSEQQLIDCSKKYGNNGCNGGSTIRAYNYIKVS